MIKKIVPLFFCILLLFGCSERMAMTRDSYTDIEVVMSALDLEKMYGKPYSIYSKGDGTETYEYIERVRSGQQVLELRRYYIVIANGKVVGKYLKVSSTPAYDDIYSESPYPNNSW